MFRFLNGYKTYISAGAIFLFALAGLAGVDMAELQNQAQEIYLLVTSFAAILSKIHKDVRAPG